MIYPQNIPSNHSIFIQFEKLDLKSTFWQGKEEYYSKYCQKVNYSGSYSLFWSDCWQWESAAVFFVLVAVPFFRYAIEKVHIFI